MITGFLYTALWLILAAYLFYMAVRQYKILFLLSGFMTFLGVWELINTLTELDMKSGVYGWIYRGVAGVILVLCLIWYFFRRRNS